MIHYRPFLNTDPPHLVEIWRSQHPERGLAQPMSLELFEQHVLAKPYFDREGLIVAVDDDKPVGFAHAAFGASDDEQSLVYTFGCTALLMVRANYQRQGIAKQLLTLSEAYLRSRGATVLYAGAMRPMNAFYLGLYGGSEMAGVLNSTPQAQQLFTSRDYREVDRCSVLHLDLKRFRAVVDRKQMQIRRSTTVAIREDAPPPNWWQACLYAPYCRTSFELLDRTDGRLLAHATSWSMTPLAANWGVHAAGLVDLAVVEDRQRQGLATFIIGEAFKHLLAHGMSLVEVQTMQRNTAALALYQKLGFTEVDQGVVYRKQ